MVDDDAMWGFEPHVAEKIFREMLAEAGVKLVCGERLDLKAGVRKQARRIVCNRHGVGRGLHRPHVHRRHL